MFFLKTFIVSSWKKNQITFTWCYIFLEGVEKYRRPKLIPKWVRSDATSVSIRFCSECGKRKTEHCLLFNLSQFFPSQMCLFSKHIHTFRIPMNLKKWTLFSNCPMQIEKFESIRVLSANYYQFEKKIKFFFLLFQPYSMALDLWASFDLAPFFSKLITHKDKKCSVMSGNFCHPFYYAVCEASC